eukprot:767198-Hanusia_phi.AAC.6
MARHMARKGKEEERYGEAQESYGEVFESDHEMCSQESSGEARGRVFRPQARCRSHHLATLISQDVQAEIAETKEAIKLPSRLISSKRRRKSSKRRR